MFHNQKKEYSRLTTLDTYDQYDISRYICMYLIINLVMSIRSLRITQVYLKDMGDQG
jgi:hypothetical protein